MVKSMDLLGYTVPAVDQLKEIFSAEELEHISRLPLFSQVTVGEISTYTRNVLLRDTDQMSMASSLEVRVPFFDHELVEYAIQIPDQYKNPVFPKKLLVDALGPLLPKEIVHRPKMGFVFPWDEWIRTDLKSFCENHLTRLAGREIFRGKSVMDLWTRFIHGDRKVSWIKVWMLVVLEDWMEKNGIEA